ncbi:hypothetical protein SPRG_03114 [Saprolegnia parasitica CBS 223.65]|uniref:F-box domain-containing protein n=1 Tax=Saprolegnia parasitica (strain CBS 223.65) TaxID=695850 RepID=A0A067CN11_SAPPC|nr:hypothetical protein SPRG_03114 [Saprolegnia parasitica CBS 223.65]KDO31898.1 hypothetical protein SPRG_03114 [Saprolegnia parasitica CBS 223.65]|eukprot:XP_012197097.1 hypothetical protein SPRG_03114 [Saprolegnia parasitica CBS 223.65]
MGSEKRRSSSTPTTVLGLTHVLEAIVRCCAAPSDVLSFLAALPASTRSAPLMALYQLLRAPANAVARIGDKNPMAYLWPRLELQSIAPVAATLVTRAMPIFNVVCVHNPHTLTNVLALAVPRPARGLDVFASFVNTWGPKLTHLSFSDRQIPRTVDVQALCAMLKRCTNLHAVDVSPCAYDTAIVAAVTTPAHTRLRCLIILSKQREPEPDWAVTLVPWLKSGRARHLGFAYYNDDDDNDNDDDDDDDDDDDGGPPYHTSNHSIAHVLAAAASLVSLHLDLHPAGSITSTRAGPWFLHLQELRVSIVDQGYIMELLKHVNPTVLTSLAIEYGGEGNLDCVLHALPRLVALQELIVDEADFKQVSWPPSSTMPPLMALRRLAFHNVEFSTTALDALATYASRSPALQTLSWRGCRWNSHLVHVVATHLHAWVGCGVKAMHLIDCNINALGVAKLAAALAGLCSPLGFQLCVSCTSPLENVCMEPLLDALTTCDGVALLLNRDSGALVTAARDLACHNIVVPIHTFNWTPDMEATCVTWRA